MCARGARKPSVVLGNSDCWMDRATFISCSRRSSSRCVSASRNAALTCLRMVMGAASDDLITKLSRNAPRIAPRLSPNVYPSARKRPQRDSVNSTPLHRTYVGRHFSGRSLPRANPQLRSQVSRHHRLAANPSRWRRVFRNWDHNTVNLGRADAVRVAHTRKRNQFSARPPTRPSEVSERRKNASCVPS